MLRFDKLKGLKWVGHQANRKEKKGGENWRLEEEELQIAMGKKVFCAGAWFICSGESKRSDEDEWAESEFESERNWVRLPSNHLSTSGLVSWSHEDVPLSHTLTLTHRSLSTI